MPTDCSAGRFEFARVEGHAVVASFDGGTITSDAGTLLLGATDRAIGLVRRFAACFVDRRAADQVEHGVATLVGQRVFALALGYEDLVDHDQLRHDPVLAAVTGKLTARRSGCAALAGKSTLNRLEHAPAGEPTRYHKIGHDGAAIERLFVELFLDAYGIPPAEIVLDLGASRPGRVRLHSSRGQQAPEATTRCMAPRRAGSFTATMAATAISRSTCSAATICWQRSCAARTSTPAPARWRRSRGSWRTSAAAGPLRGRHAGLDPCGTGSTAPRSMVRLILRADSGCARDELMSWCEANAVDYVLGLARNARLVGAIAGELALAKAEAEQSGKAARCFKDFRYQTLDSWSRERRVVGKAEQLLGSDAEPSPNPRFMVTSLAAAAWAPKPLYEELYCARGEMENRIKECQLDLFADRTSTGAMRANQLRLWFASLAYVLLEALRRIALPATRLAQATAGTIRLRLLKIGALVGVSVRRVAVQMASGHPWQRDWAIAYQALSTAAG